MSDLIENSLRRDLFTISSLWDALLDLPRAPTGHTTGTHEPPLPLPAGILSLRFDAAHTLACWAHLIWDERHLTTGLDLLATIPITRFLTRHAEWLSRHPAARDAADEIGHIADTITELVKQTRARHMIVGHCPYCAGQLIASVRPCDAMLPSEVRCTLEADHVWPAGAWRVLDRLINTRPVLVRDEGAAHRLAAAITSGHSQP